MKISIYAVVFASFLFSGCITEDVIRSENTNVSFNGTLSYGLSEINLTDGFIYKYNGVCILEHEYGNSLGICTNFDLEENDIININITNTNNITIYGQSGTGIRAACFDSIGHLISSTNLTSNFLTC